MTYIITSACIDNKDKSCVNECPVDCIYEGNRMLYINPEECIDCGACEPVCPTDAIYHVSMLPENEKEFQDINKSFFKETGFSGGATIIKNKMADESRVVGYNK